MLVRLAQEPSDQVGLIVSAYLASDHVRRKNPILSLKNSTNWDTAVHALGYTTNTYTMTTSITPEKVAALRELLEREWPSKRAEASAQEIPSIAEKLWNLMLAARAGRYSVWQLLRLTNLHSSIAKSSRKRIIVQLGHNFQHIPRVDDMLADGTSRWPKDNVHENVVRLTNQDGWREQNIQAHNRLVFSPLLRNKLPAGNLDAQIWLAMNRAQDATTLRRG